MVYSFHESRVRRIIGYPNVGLSHATVIKEDDIRRRERLGNAGGILIYRR